MTDKKAIREQIWNSLDMVAVRMSLFCGGMVGLIEVLFVFLLLPKSPVGPNRWLVFGLMTAISVSPFLIFSLFRSIQLMRHPEGYHFCKTTLSNPIGGRFRDTIRFTVLLEDADGSPFVANTHSIFLTHRSFLGLALEDYIHKTVTVGYNEETDQVVVIG